VFEPVGVPVDPPEEGLLVVVELLPVLKEDPLVCPVLDEPVPPELDEEGDPEEDDGSPEVPAPEAGSRPLAVPATVGTVTDPEMLCWFELDVVVVVSPAFGAVVEE
jgi:hypothetical protein